MWAMLRMGRIFDTPSLQGNCLGTLVSGQEPMKTQGIAEPGICPDTGASRFHWQAVIPFFRWRVYGAREPRQASALRFDR